MNTIEQRIDDWIEAHRAEELAFLSALVKTPSEVIPPVGSEAACQALVEEGYRAAGAGVDVFSPIDVPGLREHPALSRRMGRRSAQPGRAAGGGWGFPWDRGRAVYPLFRACRYRAGRQPERLERSRAVQRSHQGRETLRTRQLGHEMGHRRRALCGSLRPGMRERPARGYPPGERPGRGIWRFARHAGLQVEGLQRRYRDQCRTDQHDHRAGSPRRHGLEADLERRPRQGFRRAENHQPGAQAGQSD